MASRSAFIIRLVKTIVNPPVWCEMERKDVHRSFSSSLRYYLPTARLLAARICRKSAMCGMKFGNARGRVFVSAQRYGQSYKSPDSLAERRSGSGDPFAQLTCTAQSDSRKFAFALCTSGVAPPSHRITTCSYHKCYKI